jgi:hypothetical protein
MTHFRHFCSILTTIFEFKTFKILVKIKLLFQNTNYILDDSIQNLEKGG